MYSTPRKSVGGGANRTKQKVALKGLFIDGVWHCNCDPRLPASHFQVKKDGPNRGRWFYTCQESKDSGCGFFLWDTDAAPREMKSVINNTRSETENTFRTPADANRDDAANKNTVAGHIAASEKWIADYAKAEEDEFGDFSLTADDIVQLDTPTKPAGLYPETPRKVAKTDAVMTPGSKRKRDEDPFPTPQSGHDDGSNASSKFTRLKGGMWDGNERPGLLSPSATPTPARFRDAMQGQADPVDYDITTEVMEILQSQNLDDETSKSLKDVLNKHALKMSGIIKGRDITRMALKTKDNKIAELQQRIAALETERDMDKIIIRNIKDDITRSVEARRGRGGFRGRGRGRGET